MKYEFDYRISDEEKITQQVLYANAKFDIKNVLSDNTNRNSSVSVITPTQMLVWILTIAYLLEAMLECQILF